MNPKERSTWKSETESPPGCFTWVFCLKCKWMNVVWMFSISSLLWKCIYKARSARERRRHGFYAHRSSRASDSSFGCFLVQLAAERSRRRENSTRRVSGPVRREMGEQQVDTRERPGVPTTLSSRQRIRQSNCFCSTFKWLYYHIVFSSIVQSLVLF